MSSNEEAELTFWEHLEEMLRRLRTMFYAIIISVLFVMVFPIGINLSSFSISDPWYTTVASFVINRIERDFLPPGVELMPINWYGPLQVYIFVSLIIGVSLSSPVIAYEIYKFTNPALYEHEKRAIVPFIVSFTILFVFGLFLGYVLVMPATVHVLVLSAETLGLSPRYEFEQFFSLVAGGLLVCGFVMTFPIYLVLLIRAGIVEAEQFKKNRKYLYGAILIGISLLDPDPTLITEMFLGIPLILILEVTIRVASRFEKTA